MPGSAKPKPTKLFMSLIQVAKIAHQTEPADPSTLIPGLVLHRHPDGTVTAFTGKYPREFFTGLSSDLSPKLIAILDKAPTMAWDDSLSWSARRPGKPRIIKGVERRITAGVNLDNLPSGVPRPKLRRVMEAAILTSKTARVVKKASMRAQKVGPADVRQAEKTISVALAKRAAAPAIPKGLEIDMEGTFVALGERSSRPKKRPARYAQ
ncbi:MAG: hypothetical protein LQ346_000165 [Caloplaca aetnensis]|nr:MAG: hypothetical protein LQ346_000165 [Caloplaca aetnensis]